MGAGDSCCPDWPEQTDLQGRGRTRAKPLLPSHAQGPWSWVLPVLPSPHPTAHTGAAGWAPLLVCWSTASQGPFFGSPEQLQLSSSA